MRFLLNLIVSICLVFQVIPAPAYAQFANPVDTIEPFDGPIGDITVSIDLSVYEPPSATQAETVILPFIDSLGRHFEVHANLTNRTFVFYSSSGTMGSGVLRHEEAIYLRQAIKRDGTQAVICATPFTLGVCMTILGGVVTGIIGGIGYLIGSETECGNSYQNALRDLTAQAMSCASRPPRSDGKEWTFEVGMLPSNQICNSVGYGTCVAR